VQTGTLNEQNLQHHWFRYVIVLISAALVSSACKTSESDPVTSNVVSYQVTFVASSEGGIGPTRAVIVLDEEFATLDGNTGCHRILGSFTIDDNSETASFTVPGLSTNSCEPERQIVEDLLLDALAEVANFRRSGAQLEFSNSNADLLLRFEPFP
jgi:heat shock protein HslJ